MTSLSREIFADLTAGYFLIYYSHMPKIILKPKEERRVLAGHLWVFNNEIASIEDLQENGEIVDIYSWGQKFIARGYYNRHSLISARILTYQKEEIDSAFFAKRIRRAYHFRQQLYPGLDSYRLFFSEADLLPGLIVDKYQDYLVAQFLTLGIEKLSAQIIEALTEVFNPQGILLRNDSPTREREGLEQKVEVIYGEVPDELVIDEYGLKFQVDSKSGQKTGFFFDQRENRQIVRNMSKDKKVLDCFCYSGGFALNACQGGANSVLAVDESEPALELVRANADLNGFAGRVTAIQADCFEKLRDLQKRGEKFDLVILDPPAFVKSKEKLGEALKGYKEINLSAMKLLSPEGIIVTCSCSYQLSEEDFLKMLRSSARDSKRTFKLLNFTTQTPDHPILLSMPETKYLKCAFLQAID